MSAPRTEAVIAGMRETEQDRFLGGTAIEVYGLRAIGAPLPG